MTHSPQERLEALIRQSSSSNTTGFIPGNGWYPPPRIDPEAAAAIPQITAEIEAALVPATPKRIRNELGALGMVCRVENKSEEMWEIVLKTFIFDLGEYPADIIEAACQQWRRTKIFWPTISEFLEIARPMLSARKTKLDRVRVLARVADNPSPDARGMTLEWYQAIALSAHPDSRRGLRKIALPAGIDRSNR